MDSEVGKVGLAFPQFLTVAAEYYSALYPSYKTTKKINFYGNKVYYALEDVHDQVEAGCNAPWKHLLKDMVKRTTLRHAKSVLAG